MAGAPRDRRAGVVGPQTLDRRPVRPSGRGTGVRVHRPERAPGKGFCLSSDGLRLSFQADLGQGPVLLQATRPSLKAKWQTPQPLPVKLPDHVTGVLTWPLVTSDQRWLFCTGESGSLLGRIMLYQRPSAEGPFEGPVFLRQPGTGGPLFGRAPRYVEKTKELFFAAPNPIADASYWPTANWDLWVLRGFDPPTAWRTGVRHSEGGEPEASSR